MHMYVYGELVRCVSTNQCNVSLLMLLICRQEVERKMKMKMKKKEEESKEWVKDHGENGGRDV